MFYFSPGHEVYPIYHNKDVQTVLRNAVKWAHNQARFPAAQWEGRMAKPYEPITAKGPTLASRGPRR